MTLVLPAAGLFTSDIGSGAPVLMVHGQPGLGTDFSAVVERLEDDHRLLAPDRPGYGRSGDEPRSMAENADALARFLEDRSAVPATVVGHSYGGGVAILLAARRPELVAGLVLVASVGRAESVNAFDHLLAAPLVGPALSAASLFAFGRVLPRLRALPIAAPQAVAERLRVSLPDLNQLDPPIAPGRQIRRSFLFEQRALLREIDDVVRSVRRITAPSEVVVGQWDVIVPPNAAAALAAAIPGAKLVVVERMGHFLPRDAPDAVAAAVRSVEARAASRRKNV